MVDAHFLVGASRPGRRFQPIQELDLRADVLRACTELPTSRRGIIVQEEMPGPIGIPDATVLIGGRDRLCAREASGIPPILNRLDVAILVALPTSAPRSAEFLANTLHWEPQTVSRRIRHLVSNGAVARTLHGSFIRDASVVPLGRVIAVEAKVNNAVGALAQARTYSSWADTYVLVMSQLSSRVMGRLAEEVSGDGGGLMVASRWVVRPRLGTHSRVQALLGSEFFFDSLRRGAQTQPSVLP
jgi:hypothetical protein